jgi:hypothetical protein
MSRAFRAALALALALALLVGPAGAPPVELC